jgi:hypothetical protein
MSLQEWQNNGWIRPHKTDKQEISNLIAVAERDFADAQLNDMSDDCRFGVAYNAVLKLCTIMLYAHGYRPENTLAHYRTLMSIEYTIGPHRKGDVYYLNACRAKRNNIEYDFVGGVSRTEALELLAFAKELKKEVLKLLSERFPDLCPDESGT